MRVTEDARPLRVSTGEIHPVPPVGRPITGDEISAIAAVGRRRAVSIKPIVRALTRLLGAIGVAVIAEADRFNFRLKKTEVVGGPASR